MNYQPKGSQCANCKKKLDDCSKLDFSKMRAWGEIPHEKTVIVICSKFTRAPQFFVESEK